MKLTQRTCCLAWLSTNTIGEFEREGHWTLWTLQKSYLAKSAPGGRQKWTNRQFRRVYKLQMHFKTLKLSFNSFRNQDKIVRYSYITKLISVILWEKFYEVLFIFLIGLKLKIMRGSTSFGIIFINWFTQPPLFWHFMALFWPPSHTHTLCDLTFFRRAVFKIYKLWTIQWIITKLSFKT